MILFAEDYIKEPVHVHLETSNSSFIRMSIVLKRMGIKNHNFFLSLKQASLRNVDPHSPHLDLETKLKILVEVKTNPWYYFREVLKIPASGDVPVPFELHRANLAAIWTYLNDIDFGLVQPRQTGKTFVTQSIVSHYMYIYADNVDIGMITKDTPLVQDNVKRLKELRDTLPSYVVTRSTKDWDRKEGISYAQKNNFYKTYTAPIDERSAFNVGRGNKFAILHYDEIAYLRYNQIIVSTTANSMLAASEQVRKVGLPSISIYTTTAGNPDTKEGAFALALLRDGLEFSETFYDFKNREALMEIMKTSARAKMMYIEYSYRQLGKSDEWFRDACRKSKGSQDDINRDLLNIWQAASDKAVIEQRYITQIRESKVDPLYTDISDGFLVKWYIPKETVESPEFINRPLIMGMDTSENVERDYTTFAIVDPRDMRLMATCRCNDVNLMTVAAHISKLLMTYTGLVWIPERNNTGSGIIDFVIADLQKAGINPFFRIFNMAVHERSEPKYEKVDLYNYKEIHGAIRSVFGYRTAGSSASTARNMLYKSTLKKAVEMNSTRICDNLLINEMCSLTIRGGRVDHPVGGHDDTVIAYLLACFMIYFGNNLNMYGIPISSVLESVDSTGKEVDPDFKSEQLLLRKKISELEQLLLSSPGSILKFGYERELRKLRMLIDENAVQIQPRAVAQVSHQEQIMKEQTKGSSETQIRNFVTRFNNAR